MLAGNREPDISHREPDNHASSSRRCHLRRDLEDCHQRRRGKTGSRSISKEFEAELVKKVFGQQAELSQNSVADRTPTRDVPEHRRQDVTMSVRRGSVVGLRDPESAAQRDSRQHGRTHGSASREVRKASRSQRKTCC